MDPAAQNNPHAPDRLGHGHAEEHPDGHLTEAEAWERTTEAGIRMMRIPTPFAVGRVNVFLIEDDPLTLVDTGPNSGKALDELDVQLRSLGYTVPDIERVLVTHQHIDHSGLVAIVARRAEAEVVTLDRLKPWLENYTQEADLDDEFAGDLMRRHGIPPDMVTALMTVSGSFRLWGSGAPVDRTLADGEVLEFANRRLEVQLRPGHSPTDTLFWDADRRLLLGGDHLLGHISSNPLISRPLEGADERPRSLLDYIASMSKTAELPADVILPGHGEPVTGHRELIEKRLGMHERRAERLHGLLEKTGPMTAHAMAHELWGNVAVTQAFLTLSEIIGHMDLLEQREQVKVEETEGTVRYRAIS